MSKKIVTTWTALLLIGLGLSLGSSRVLAQEHEKAAANEHSSHEQTSDGGAKSPSILTGDWGNVFWTSTIFIVLLIVLRATAWKPILTALQKREQFITSSLADAKRDREEAKKVLENYTRKVEQSRIEASAIVEEGRKDAEALRRKLHEDTNREVQDMLARAQRDIKVARETAVAELYSHTLDLAASVAGKIVHKQLSPADHRALLDESISELAKMSH